MGRRRRWLAIAMTAATVLGAASTSGAQESPATLPPPTLSSTDLHVGDVVDVSGTGCIDPETGSGEGLQVMVFRWRQGRGDVPTNEVWFPVDADGSYAGTWTIGQTLPNGGVSVAVMCVGGSLDAYDLLSDRLPANGTAPMLPDIVGAAGSVVPIAYGCPETGYGYEITVLGQSIDFEEDFIGSVGQTMHGEIPAHLAPGTHDGLATCSSEGGTYAYFNVQVIVTEPGAAAKAPAEPATPRSGRSAYTG